MNFSFKPRAIERVLAQEKFDILHFHNMDVGLLTWQVLRASSATNILTFHGALDGSRMMRWFPWLKEIGRMAYGSKIDGAIGVSGVAFEVLKNFSGPKVIIPNGVDLQRFSPDGELIARFSDGAPTILFIGRFEKRKGLMYALEAYKNLLVFVPDARMIVVGDGAMREEAEGFVRENNLNNVHFEGVAEEVLLPSYYRSATVLCAPSLYGESFGMILLEAMACGTPVVGFANAGYSSVLRTPSCEKSSFEPRDILVKPGDATLLARAMKKILCDTRLHDEVRAWGLAHCQEFSWDKVAQKVLEFYEEVGRNKMQKKNRG
jgi:phosphatidylinositol alpha-mannosyltransferase